MQLKKINQNGTLNIAAVLHNDFFKNILIKLQALQLIECLQPILTGQGIRIGNALLNIPDFLRS